MTDWPVALAGVTETVVTTRGPNGRYNVAALGVHAPGNSSDCVDPTARTWGRTRTRRNFERTGEGYIQFTRDPVVFVEAALAIREQEQPVLPSADAWVRVAVERLDSGTDGGTEWVDWRLLARDRDTRRQVVATVNRGYGAVVEATVAVSRLGVTGYDDETLRARIEHCASVVERCGGPAEHEAFDRLQSILEAREGSGRGADTGVT